MKWGENGSNREKTPDYPQAEVTCRTCASNPQRCDERFRALKNHSALGSAMVDSP